MFYKTLYNASEGIAHHTLVKRAFIRCKTAKNGWFNTSCVHINLQQNKKYKIVEMA